MMTTTGTVTKKRGKLGGLRDRSKPEVDKNAFARWRHQRPFPGALLSIIAGIEMFFSGQLDIGKIHIAVGIEGFQATIIPIALILLGVLVMFMPQHRIFYGIIILAIALYSLIGDNIGGFVIGMLLGSIGGILIVSWMPKTAPDASVIQTVERPVTADAPAATTQPVVAYSAPNDGQPHAEYVKIVRKVQSEPRPLVASRS